MSKHSNIYPTTLKECGIV